jgi:hypothetical protein
MLGRAGFDYYSYCSLDPQIPFIFTLLQKNKKSKKYNITKLIIIS